MIFSARPFTLWMLALLIALPVLAITTWRASSAAAAESAAAKKRQRVTAQAEELKTLRVGLPAWARTSTQRNSGEHSESMAQRVPAAIAAAGLPPTALSSVSPESQSGTADGGSKGGVGIDRRKATLTFNTLTLTQLGRFLSTWREREPAWVVTSIDATPEQRASSDRGANQTQPGGDLPLRIVLVIESLSVRLPKAVNSASTRSGSLLPASRASSPSPTPTPSKPQATPASSTAKPSVKRQGDFR